VHQDESEAVFYFEHCKFVVAATFGDFEFEAALKEVGKRRNIGDAQINVIEFQHGIAT
jgi:hypothetical protein